MGRYFRLLRHFISFSFSRSLMFRLDFFFRIIMDVFYYAVNIAFFRLLFGSVSTLGGWRFDETLVFVSIFLVVDAIHMTFFSNNMWVLPILINRGELDYYLVRPVNSLFFVSFRDFAANSFFNLIITVGILAYALWNYQDPITLPRLTILVLAILGGSVLHYFIRMLFNIPVFWTHAPRGFDGLFFQLGRFMERPDRIYSGAVRVLLTTVLPFSLVASWPARLFLEGWDWGVVLHMTAIIGLFWVGVVGFWNFGLRSYSSASS